MTAGAPLAIFDIDKTLVARDSFRLVGDLCARGHAERGLRFGFAAICRLVLMTNTRYKKLVLRQVWARGTDAFHEEKLAELHDCLQALLIEPGVHALEKHAGRGDNIAVLSASPLFYLTSLQHSSASFFCSPLLPHPSATFFCLTPLQPSFALPLFLTPLQPSSATLFCNLPL